ncbi:MAG: anaerobic sulfatase maturase [Phycisphaerae bacterium]
MPRENSQSVPGFHVMAKPIGPRCNLNCEYCYYLEKDQLYPGERNWRMSDDTLALFIEQFIAAQPDGASEIEFAWQGGEPTLLGVDFFRRVVELQGKFTPPGKRCRNTIQTNGVLLDDAWCAFLREHDFLVGLSIDGPADLHDRWRRDRRGRSTFDRVMRGLRNLQKHGVAYNALTVVNRHNGSHPRRVYRFLKDTGFEFIQFIPIVEPIGAGGDGSRNLDALVSKHSVRPRQFGRFLCEIFDEWIQNDVGRVFVQAFDQALAAWLGLEPSLCIFRRQCGQAMVLEHNGDLYSCDHFVTPQNRLGNIHEAPLSELARGPQQTQFGRDKEEKLPALCRECEVRFVCNGECPKNRLSKTPGAELRLNYLCEGFKLFFRHIDPLMRAMADEVRQGRPAANVTYSLRRQAQQAACQQGRVGRNDPCPCGSGKKYKNCCARLSRDSRPIRV